MLSFFMKRISQRDIKGQLKFNEVLLKTLQEEENKPYADINDTEIKIQELKERLEKMKNEKKSILKMKKEKEYIPEESGESYSPDYSVHYETEYSSKKKEIKKNKNPEMIKPKPNRKIKGRKPNNNFHNPIIIEDDSDSSLKKVKTPNRITTVVLIRPPAQQPSSSLQTEHKNSSKSLNPR